MTESMTIEQFRSRKIAKPAVKATHFIGVDPGTHTGFALWDGAHKSLELVLTCTIIEAQGRVLRFLTNFCKEDFLIRIEDARKRTWFGESGPEKWKGAGSVMRDCKIWEEFCEHHGLNYEMVHPKDIQQINDAKVFNQITKWQGRSSEHSRIAAMLVFGR